MSSFSEKAQRFVGVESSSHSPSFNTITPSTGPGSAGKEGRFETGHVARVSS